MSKINLDFDFLFKLLCENEKLLKELREEKAAHTETKNRVIFATHILNGNRDEATKEFTSEYDKQIESLTKENGKLNREIENYKKSLTAWHSKFNKMV
jgi:predicted RNase H-like nuclease (RuvC/YqgF family)